MKNPSGLRVPLLFGRTGDFLVKSLSKDRLDLKRWELTRGDEEGLFKAEELGEDATHDKGFITLIHRDKSGGKWDGMKLVMGRSQLSLAGVEQAETARLELDERKQKGWEDVLRVWGVSSQETSLAEGESSPGGGSEEEPGARYAVKLRASNGRIFDGGEGPGLAALWVKLERQLMELEAPKAMVEIKLLPPGKGFLEI